MEVVPDNVVEMTSGGAGQQVTGVRSRRVRTVTLDTPPRPAAALDTWWSRVRRRRRGGKGERREGPGRPHLPFVRDHGA
jgi:hypothetical protein